MKNAKIIGLLLGTAMLATACGGGGGGSGSAVIDMTKPAPGAPAAPTLTLELAAGTSLSNINAAQTISAVTTLTTPDVTITETVAFNSDGTIDIQDVPAGSASWSVANEFFTITADGRSATYDVNELGIDVVANTDGNFFITDAASNNDNVAFTTGTYTTVDAVETRYGSSGLASDVRDAHIDGYTGKGITVTISGAFAADAMSASLIEDIAPDAIVAHGDLYETRVSQTGSTSSILVGDDDYGSSGDINLNLGGFTQEYAQVEDLAIAGGVAIVWDKFDNLSSDNIISLVNQVGAANDGIFDLSDTLSPVGNLR